MLSELGPVYVVSYGDNTPYDSPVTTGSATSRRATPQPRRSSSCRPQAPVVRRPRRSGRPDATSRGRPTAGQPLRWRSGAPTAGAVRLAVISYWPATSTRMRAPGASVKPLPVVSAAQSAASSSHSRTCRERLRGRQRVERAVRHREVPVAHDDDGRATCARRRTPARRCAAVRPFDLDRARGQEQLAVIGERQRLLARGGERVRLHGGRQQGRAHGDAQQLVGGDRAGESSGAH